MLRREFLANLTAIGVALAAPIALTEKLVPLVTLSSMVEDRGVPNEDTIKEAKDMLKELMREHQRKLPREAKLAKLEFFDETFDYGHTTGYAIRAEFVAPEQVVAQYNTRKDKR